MKTTGLSLIEAVRSGKRFRRKGWEGWVEPCESAVQDFQFSRDGIMADDWETEPEKKPRMLAWRDALGVVRLFSEEDQAKIHNSELWVRAPHLDEPESP